MGSQKKKKAYLLYSHECRKIFKSHDVEFEEIEGHEWVTVDSDSDDEGVLDAPNTGNGDPEEEHTVDAPSTPVEEVDHQEVQKTTPNTHTHSSGTQPTPLCHSTCSNKGIPPIQPDEDPKLAQGSRPSVKKMETPGTQDQVGSSVGANRDNNREPLLHVVDDDIRAVYLAADTPQMYQEAMRHSNANGRVEAVTEEYNNLHCKGIFDEVKAPLDTYVSMRGNWCSLRRSVLLGK